MFDPGKLLQLRYDGAGVKDGVCLGRVDMQKWGASQQITKTQQPKRAASKKARKQAGLIDARVKKRKRATEAKQASLFRQR